MKIVLGLYVVASALTFFVYALDKFKAQKGMWRIKEKTLHILEFCCGWPGAMLAQKFLRHKSYKPSFRRLFWCATIGNISLVIVLSIVICLG